MDENDAMGKVYHEQIKLPLFPVLYDVFFCTDMWMVSGVLQDRYPGVTLDVPPHTTSMTSLVRHPIKGTGIAVIFSVGTDDFDLRSAIVFEATNVAWLVLGELDIEVDVDNNKLHSYLV